MMVSSLPRVIQAKDSLSHDVDLAVNEKSTLVVVQEDKGTSEMPQMVSIVARLQAGAELTICVISLGEIVGSVLVDVTFLGEEARCDLSGLSLVSGQTQLKLVTSMHHDVPSCFSRQTFKYVVSDHAVTEHEGKVHVKQHAQLTDSAQSNQSLLLSPNARVITRPQLEIYADDVKAAHGASIGQLDSEAVFYLQSRGFSLEAAKRLLLEGFVSEILDQLPEGCEDVKRQVLDRLI